MREVACKKGRATFFLSAVLSSAEVAPDQIGTVRARRDTKRKDAALSLAPCFRPMALPMKYRCLPLSLGFMLLTVAAEAGAVSSAELYQNQTYTYGRFEARIRFGAGDGVISSFFLWKPGSEMPGTFWNELDFEKLGADCRLQTNPLYGLPMADHHQFATLQADLCGEYHTYTFEWTPSSIAYLVDGVEIRRDGEEVAAAFVENAAAGMQMHFNIWPGDASFGGNFDPGILPVQQYISWVQYSSFADGVFTFQWRDEFDGPTLPSRWALGNWASPKNLSTHQSANVTLTGGFAVLSLTADAATGFIGAPPPDVDAGSAAGPEPSAGAGGAAGAAGGSPPVAAVGGADSGGASGGAPGNSSSAIAGAAGTAAASSVAGASAASPEARRSSSDSGCSQSASSPARSDSMAWLAVALGTIACRGRSRWHQRRRPAARR
jgi:endo-1,3-1,4-beta-glycanase ExoK